MKFQHLRNSRMLIDAQPGVALSTCIRECITNAINFDTVIILVHNGKTFTIDPEEIISPIRMKGMDSIDSIDRNDPIDNQLMSELENDGGEDN